MNSTQNVFLIDDDPICNFLHKNLIQNTLSSCQITTFSDATAFLEYLTFNLNQSDTLPHYILLDINMPEMNGWDFLDEYKDLKMPSLKHIKVYMVTSSENEIDIERSKKYNFIKGYFPKPLNEKKLAEIFKELL